MKKDKTVQEALAEVQRNVEETRRQRVLEQYNSINEGGGKGTGLAKWLGGAEGEGKALGRMNEPEILPPPPKSTDVTPVPRKDGITIDNIPDKSKWKGPATAAAAAATAGGLGYIATKRDDRSDTNDTIAQTNDQTPAPTPAPSTTPKNGFKDAFAAARKAHGGSGGTFDWNGKKYTTNLATDKPASSRPAKSAAGTDYEIKRAESLNKYPGSEGNRSAGNRSVEAATKEIASSSPTPEMSPAGYGSTTKFTSNGPSQKSPYVSQHGKEKYSYGPGPSKFGEQYVAEAGSFVGGVPNQMRPAPAPVRPAYVPPAGYGTAPSWGSVISGDAARTAPVGMPVTPSRPADVANQLATPNSPRPQTFDVNPQKDWERRYPSEIRTAPKPNSDLNNQRRVPDEIGNIRPDGSFDPKGGGNDKLYRPGIDPKRNPKPVPPPTPVPPPKPVIRVDPEPRPKPVIPVPQPDNIVTPPAPVPPPAPKAREEFPIKGGHGADVGYAEPTRGGATSTYRDVGGGNIRSAADERAASGGTPEDPMNLRKRGMGNSPNVRMKEETNPMIAAFLKLNGSAHPNIFEAAKKLPPKLRGLAALTPPEDEITRGDVIAGAKMNAKMKNEAADAPMDSDVTGPSNIKGPKIPKPVRADKANKVPMDSDVTGSSNIKGPKIPAPVPVKETWVQSEKPYSGMQNYTNNLANDANKAAADRTKPPAPGAGPAKMLSKPSITTLKNAPLPSIHGGGFKKIPASSNEEVQWSDAELAHIQSILGEAVAPTPDQYSGPKDPSVSLRDLTDETKKPWNKKPLKEDKVARNNVGDRVEVNMPGSAAHGHSGILKSVDADGMAKVHLNPNLGATGTQTKMGDISGLNARMSGTHTYVPLSRLKLFYPDNVQEETELEEARGKAMPGRGRGRPKGSKSGAAGETAQGEGSGGGATHPTIEIRDAFKSGNFKNGKVTVTHPDTGEKAEVPKEEAKVFYGLHHSMNKAADRVKVTHKFLEKHFGHGYSSEHPEAHEDDAAGSAGYSAPSKVSLPGPVYDKTGKDIFGNKLRG